MGSALGEWVVEGSRKAERERENVGMFKYSKGVLSQFSLKQNFEKSF